MIQATELRISNIVDVLNESGYISPDTGYNWTVKELRSDFVVLEKKGIAVLHVFYDKLSPITLTEEWLVKSLGFEKKETYYPNSNFSSYHYQNKACWIYLIESGFEIEIITTRNTERFNIYKTFKYVHELQNALFVLKSEELIIKEVI